MEGYQLSCKNNISKKNSLTNSTFSNILLKTGQRANSAVGSPN
jgi:hypothetical protein